MISHELQIKNLQVHIIDVFADYQEAPILHFNAMNLIVALLDNNNGEHENIKTCINNLILQKKITPGRCFEIVFTLYVEDLPW